MQKLVRRAEILTKVAQATFASAFTLAQMYHNMTLKTLSQGVPRPRTSLCTPSFIGYSCLFISTCYVQLIICVSYRQDKLHHCMSNLRFA